MDTYKCRISVIVPLYRGRKYLPGMTAQIEACGACTPGADIELVYANDQPDDRIGDCVFSTGISIKVIDTDRNRGIHGARIRGFLESAGEYVVFLDQDDQIMPEYFLSQLHKIGTADAVVCNAMSGGRLKYDTDRPLCKAGSRDSMISEGNMILSPGQVLLRREAVPKSWIENRMQQSGADDWLLWLCMHSEGRQFAVNEDVLFIREVHYHNASLDCGKMSASEREAVKIVEERRLLEPDERERLRALLPKLQERRAKENEKWKKMFLIQTDWFALHNRGRSIAGYLMERNIKSAAIYGYGYLGRTLLSDLEKSGIEVAYVIDKNAAYVRPGKKCYTPDEEPERADAVIVTLVSGRDKALEEKIKEKTGAEIFWLEDIITALS